MNTHYIDCFTLHLSFKLQALAIKSELKVAMRYKNFKAVAMRCKNKGKPKARVTKIVLLYNKILDYVSVSVGARTWLFVSFV